jgi:frataxin-like iron-binding protein CyaY
MSTFVIEGEFHRVIEVKADNIEEAIKKAPEELKKDLVMGHNNKTEIHVNDIVNFTTFTVIEERN